MFVLTVDQQSSTGRADLVPSLLADLAAHLDGAPGVALGFERTVGDEVQGVLGDAATTVDVVLALVRRGGWSIGLGLGPVSTPLPATSREATGAAFVHARAAVDQAKGRGSAVPLAVVGPSAGVAAEVEALLQLLGATVQRRTERAWQVIDALARAGGVQKDVAAELGISAQAVSRSLRTSLWHEEAAVRPLVARLLHEADETDEGDG
ncbi:helix-turn-helix domain-containing protein [Oerskovia flava]|uniref:helix-turn-helix domain-containing protein n=1 Tax=Oerskovia flava TaxID=2986422 RepID=UPI0022406E28|nr:helix-turn-helix domain-containing protein [Oerskovia sp. JB1-3-2]